MSIFITMRKAEQPFIYLNTFVFLFISFQWSVSVSCLFMSFTIKILAKKKFFLAEFCLSLAEKNYYYVLYIIIYITYSNIICALYLSLKLYVFSHFRKIWLSILCTIFCSSYNLNVYIAKCVIFRFELFVLLKEIILTLKLHSEISVL